MTGGARKALTGYTFVLPWLIGLTCFIAIPFFAAGYFSFCDYPPLKGPMFIGAENYAELLSDPIFHRSLGVTTMYSAVAIPIGVVLALSLAMFLNSRIRGQAVYRVVFYLPHLVPTVVVAILWMWIFNPEAGLLNLVLRYIFAAGDWWTGLFFDVDRLVAPKGVVQLPGLFSLGLGLLLLLLCAGRRKMAVPRGLLPGIVVSCLGLLGFLFGGPEFFIYGLAGWAILATWGLAAILSLVVCILSLSSPPGQRKLIDLGIPIAGWAALAMVHGVREAGISGVSEQTLLLAVAPVLGLLAWGRSARRGDTSDSPARRLLGVLAGVAVFLALAAVVAALLYRFAPGDMRKLHAPGWLTDGDPFPAGVSFAPSWALWSIIIMSMWGVGQMAVIYLAKLQDVPLELYEAAEIDGAGWWRKTISVTIPLISPVILFNVVMSIIGAFQVFAAPYIMTQGGPENKTRFVAMFVYDQAFQYHRVGYASAVAAVLFLIIVALTLLAFRISRSYVHYEGR